MTQFQPAAAKLQIGSLDDTSLEVQAQYNPKELQRSRHVPWVKHDVFAGRDPKRDRKVIDEDAGAGRGKLHLDYNGAESRSMTLELLFDRYEDRASIEPIVDTLEALATPIDRDSRRETLSRPHRCVVTWGDRGIKPFRCVIESLDVKYTMFASDGTPLRVVCTVKLMEADILSTSTAANEQYTGRKAS